MKVLSYGLILAACLCIAVNPAFAGPLTVFGTLSNFDIYNDTPTADTVHGFEIEIHGLSRADVVYAFSANRYGAPTIIDLASGIEVVRWASSYSAGGGYAVTTPTPPAIIPTGGHSCWNSGSLNYLSSGCEHFGLSLRGNATSTAYRWLVDSATAPTGKLTAYSQNVTIPAPTWNVVQAVNQAPGVMAVQAVIAVPPEPAQQFGVAQWVKVYEKELTSPADLNNLVEGNSDVPPNGLGDKPEIEWTLLQPGKGLGHEGLSLDNPPGANAQAISRLYEFYKYAGTIDPATGEATCLAGGGTCTIPVQSELGNYIGSQMSAANLVDFAAATPEPGTLWIAGSAFLIFWRFRRRGSSKSTCPR